MILLVVWVVLMILWPVLGCRAAAAAQDYAGVLVPWGCVLVLGLVVFGVFGPVVVAR